MNLQPHFPHLLSSLGEIQSKGFGHNSIEQLWVSWKSAQGRPYFSYRQHKLNLHVYRHLPQHLSFSPATPPSLLSPGWDTLTVCKHCYDSNGNYQYGQVTSALLSKNITLLPIFLIQNNHSGSAVGQDQEFWMTNTVKHHSEEQCIQYNYTPFIEAISWDQRK